MLFLQIMRMEIGFYKYHGTLDVALQIVLSCFKEKGWFLPDYGSPHIK